MPAKRTYTVIYQPIPPGDGRGYYAHIPALGITTDGRTLKEAKGMARDAMECHLEALKKLGQPLPADVSAEQVEVPA